MIERPDDPAPETVNEEQEDEDTQAHTVAEEAQGRGSSTAGLEDSEKKKGGSGEGNEVEDLVDHIKQMDSSGNIDMSAYDGEETMDDLENRYGSKRAADKDFKDDDS